MVKQLSIWDLRDASAHPLLVELGAVGIEPLSTRELVDNLGQDADPHAPLGSQDSGCQRAKVHREVHAALKQAYLVAWAMHEDEKIAAAVLLRICARDPDFEPPEWLRGLWLDHREVLRETFEGHGDDKQTDWSEGRDEDAE